MDMITNIILELAIDGIAGAALSKKMPKGWRIVLLTLIFVLFGGLTVFFAGMSFLLAENITVSLVCAVAALILVLYILSIIVKLYQEKRN